MSKIKESEIERPLDLLNSLKGQDVLVAVKDGEELISGKLLAFDIHINLVVKAEESFIFIKGDRVVSIS